MVQLPSSAGEAPAAGTALAAPGAANCLVPRSAPRLLATAQMMIPMASATMMTAMTPVVVRRIVHPVFAEARHPPPSRLLKVLPAQRFREPTYVNRLMNQTAL